MEAEVLRAALETADIPVAMRSEFVGRLYGLTSQSSARSRCWSRGPGWRRRGALLADSSPVDFPEGD